MNRLASSQQPGQWTGLAFGSLGLALGTAPAALQPVWVQALQGMGFTATHAGLIATAELLAVTVAAVLFSLRPLAPRVSTIAPLVMLQALALVLSHQAATAGLIGARILAGTAAGALLAQAAALLATSARPGWSFGCATFVGACLTAAISVGQEALAQRAGALTSQAAPAAAWLALPALAWCMRHGLAPPSAQLGPSRGADAASAASGDAVRSRSVLLCACIFAWFLAQGVYWPFVQPTLVRAGVPPSDTADWVAVGLLAGMPGALISASLGRLVGTAQTRLALGALLVMAMAAGATVLLPRPWAAIGGVVLYNVAYFAALPGLMRRASDLDGRGRLSGLLSALSLLGMACGPWIGGWVLDHSGSPALGLSSAALTVLAALLGAAAARSARSSSPPLAPAAPMAPSRRH